MNRWPATTCPCAPLLLLLVFAVSAAGAQTSARVSGLLEDGSATPLAGVSLTLSADPGSRAAAHTTTDPHGEYDFTGLAPGRYRISSDQPGTSINPAAAFTLSPGQAPLRLTLTLTGPPADPAGASSTPSAKPALNLQAAGIRGYIDPGGYSAPASAAAATDLVRGIADLKRTGNTASGARALSCSRQTELLRVVANDPDDVPANRQLGQFYLGNHQPREALPYLQRAWSHDSSDLPALASLAEALLQQGQFQSARDLLLQHAADPKTAETHRMLARADEGLARFREASTEYLAAETLLPAEENLFGAGYERILAGEPEAGARIFQSGVLQFPQSALLLMGAGTAAFLQNHSADATRTFLRAAALNPSDPRPYPFLSASFAISGVDGARVQASFLRFYRLAPDNAEAVFFYALSLLHPGPGAGAADSAQVIALLQRSLRIDPRLAKAHEKLGYLFFDQGNYPGAIQEFEAALRLSPDRWRLRYTLSAACKRAGRADRAAQEMHLFLAHRSEKSTGGEGSDINLEEFLSVLNQPGGAGEAQPACSDRSRN